MVYTTLLWVILQNHQLMQQCSLNWLTTSILILPLTQPSWCVLPPPFGVNVVWVSCCLFHPPSPLPTTLLPMSSDLKRSPWNCHSHILHLPHNIVLVNQHIPINLISLLKNHLHVNMPQCDTSFFSYSLSASMAVLSKSLFFYHCNNIWCPLSYPHATGHCFCIGRTMELLLAGTPPEVVRVTRQWSSASFLWYWQPLDKLAPLHICNLQSSSHRPACGQYTAHRSTSTRG